MNILVIFTGGTIGCAPPDSSGVLVPDKKIGNDEDYYLISEYKKRCGKNNVDDVFKTLQPLAVLSENMTIDKWNMLLSALKNVDFSRYGGIIITHGSDTMAYTASMLSLVLSGIGIPVVLISSNYNLFDKRADGHGNFADAVDFIRGARCAGVFVIFKSEVFLGSRLTQSRHFVNKYSDVCDTVFGRMNNGKFEPNKLGKDQNEACKSSFGAPLIYRLEKLANSVLLIQPYVGLNYKAVNLHSGIRAVLHGTYHSFTACVDDENGESSIIDFYGRCKESCIELYLAPFDSALVSVDNAAKYSSTDKMLGAGIKTVCDLSLESVYAKLVLAYSLFSGAKDIDGFLNGN